MMGNVLTGAIAGAAGTTALNAATYTDMAVTGRGGSTAPKDIVDHLSDRTDVPVPGSDETRDNRASAIGALLGMVTGIGVGGLYGLARTTGWHPALPVAALATGLAAMAGSDAPMTALKVSDPRTWQPTDWIRDIVPHLTYGLVTAAVYEAASGRSGRRRRRRR